MLSILTSLFARLRGEIAVLRRSSLHLNSYALVLNQVASAGLGVLYWMIAARLYSTDVVGQNSALISTLLLLGSLGSLGLKSAMVRFVPRSGTQTTRLVLRTYGINVVATALISLGFVEVTHRTGLLTNVTGETSVSALFIVLTSLVWCIFSVQDGVLTGLRQSVWVLVENQVFNLAKMALLVPAAWFAYDAGIAISWFLPTVIIVLAVNAYMFVRLIPRHEADQTVQAAPVGAREAMPSVTGDYVGSLLSEVGVRVLPVMVVSLLGGSAGAYFYQAWIVASLLIFIAQNMAWSFTAETAADRSKVPAYSRSILRHMTYLVIPASIVIAVAAPQILGLFGPAYAAEGTTLLRYLAIAAPAAIPSVWYLAYARVRADTLSIAVIQSTPPLITVALSYWWLPTYGLTSIGVAWLASNVLVSAWAAVNGARILKEHAQDDRQVDSASANEVWRRADWRFLLPSPRPRRSAVFSSGLLARSVATVSDESLEGAGCPTGECDLAVVSNPTGTSLLEAHRVLRDGGACYTEWAAWRTGGTRNIRRQLQAAGFSDIRLYWAYPGPANARFWLPVPAGHAACRYLANHLTFGKTRLSQAAQEVVCLFLKTALQIGLVPSLSAVAYKGKADRMNLLETLDERFLKTHPAVSSKRLSYLLLTGGLRVYSSIICLVFDTNGPAPRWVAKLPRIPSEATCLHNEEKVLWQLSRVNRPHNRPVLASVVDRLSLDRMPVYVQTAVVGASFKDGLTWDSFAEMTAIMTDFQIWLASLPNPIGTQIDCLAYGDELLKQFADADGPLLDTRTVSEVRTVLARVGMLPRTLAHNDFVPWNLMRTRDGLGVIDWLESNWDAPPLTDLVYGLANAVFQLDGSWDTTGMLATYRRLLDPSTPAGAVFGEQISRYAEHAGLSEDQLAPLRMLSWIRHSCAELGLFRLEHGSDGGRRWLHESVCLRIWRLELSLQSQIQEARTTVKGTARA